MIDAVYQTTIISLYYMEALGRLVSYKAGHFIRMHTVKPFNHSVKIQVRKPITVVCKKDIFAFQILLDLQQSHTNIGLGSGIDKGNAPVGYISIEHLYISAAITINEVI